ncbi:single-stranded DNA-binding protein [Sphingobacterium sp. 1.A.5]|uniref:single-stranded DNA-binding protein n=1 Tax=Sphingobacterium sp. 1.A.5 TaxID=2044604 RepID=UPI000C0BFE79|nr:single-stranded DNA-binding protein [Sphingobacterium sp. 1.A.5]
MSTLKNSVQLLGRLGKEPEIKMSSTGAPYCFVNLVTNEYGTKKNGEQFEKSQWHRVAVWGDMTKIIQKKGKKGSLWLVQGSIVYRQFEGRDGNQHYTCEIRANRIMFLMDPMAMNKPMAEKVEV